jgi:hypothetical protein
VTPGGRGLTVCSPNANVTYNTNAGVPIQAIAVSPNTITSFTEQWENSTPREFAPQAWVNERSSGGPGYQTWRFTAKDSQGTMSQTVTILVANSSFPAPSNRSVVICSPKNGETMSGTISLTASAGNPSGTFKTRKSTRMELSGSRQSLRTSRSLRYCPRGSIKSPRKRGIQPVLAAQPST